MTSSVIRFEESTPSVIPEIFIGNPNALMICGPLIGHSGAAKSGLKIAGDGLEVIETFRVTSFSVIPEIFQTSKCFKTLMDS